MGIFRRLTITKKITIVTLAAICVGIISALAVQTTIALTEMATEQKNAEKDVARLLTLQARGGLRWEIPSAIEKVYKTYKENDVEHKLIGFSGIAASGATLFSTGEAIDKLGTASKVQAALNTLKKGEVVAVAVPEGALLLVPAFHVKYGYYLGTVATLWSHQKMYKTIWYILAASGLIVVVALAVLWILLNIIMGKMLIQPMTAFGQMVKNSLQVFSQSTRSAQNLVEEMGTNADQTVNLAQQASSLSNQTSENIDHVASAVSEMNTATADITQSVHNVAQAINNVSAQAKQTSDRLNDLDKSSKEITAVVGIINDIADQINLLALNAAIEAARAGDAGRGFSVVADEVKKLSNLTSNQVTTIQAKVDSMQSSASSSIGDIRKIRELIEGVQTDANSISVAIEEQNATSQQINENIAMNRTMMQQLDSSFEMVQQNAGTTQQSSRKASQEVQTLAKEADVLQSSIFGFIKKV